LSRKKEKEQAPAAPPPAAIAGAAPRADAPRFAAEQKAALETSKRDTVLADKAGERRAAPALGAVDTTGAASTDKRSDVASNRANQELRLSSVTVSPSRPELPVAPLMGCYVIRQGGDSTLNASTGLPTHIALDAKRVNAATEVEYEARDTSPASERTSAVFRWRPLGPLSFELIVQRDSVSRFAVVTIGASVTAAAPARQRAETTTGSGLIATREACR
jgi:hypothetical protein